MVARWPVDRVHELADDQLGYIWKVAVDGARRTPAAAPQQLTKALGEYLNTAWRPDGKTIVVTRGTGASVHGRTVAANQFYQFVKVPGRRRRRKAIITVNRPYMAGRPVMPRRPILQAHFGPDGRLFYPETFGPAHTRETEDAPRSSRSISTAAIGRCTSC